MKYSVKLVQDDFVGSPMETLEAACSQALSLSNWNVECAVLDENGVEVKHFPPYQKAAKNFR